MIGEDRRSCPIDRRRPHHHRRGQQYGTGALTTFVKSGWLMSIVVPYQPHFLSMPKDTYTLWGYGLFIDDILDDVLETTDVTTVMMPYASALFSRRSVVAVGPWFVFGMLRVKNRRNVRDQHSDRIERLVDFFQSALDKPAMGRIFALPRKVQSQHIQLPQIRLDLHQLVSRYAQRQHERHLQIDG
jgi:hypothetical protein